jgi:hypothetical protein
LASVVFCAPFIAVGLAAVIVGSVLAFTRPVNRVVTFGFLTGYERVNDWLKPLLAGAAAPVERALAR